MAIEMSDQTTTTDQTAIPTPDAGAVNQAATPATEPAPQPFAVFQDAKAFNQRLARETRKAMNEQAKQAGFDDWAHMQDAVGALRQAPAPPTQPENPQDAPGTTPAATNAPTGMDEAQRLRMALTVASDAGLPTTLVSRLQGDTPEEMTADANRLLALFQQPARGPGIPPAPQANQPATFTRTQLRDPAFVRANTAAILQASREGRIVDS